MYARQESKHRRGISVPQNYSGNAFGEDSLNGSNRDNILMSDEVTFSDPPQSESVKAQRTTKNILPFNIGNEELILIGIIILLFLDGNGDGIIPILLAILFLG